MFKTTIARSFIFISIGFIALTTLPRSVFAQTQPGYLACRQMQSSDQRLICLNTVRVATRQYPQEIVEMCGSMQADASKNSILTATQDFVFPAGALSVCVPDATDATLDQLIVCLNAAGKKNTKWLVTESREHRASSPDIYLSPGEATAMMRRSASCPAHETIQWAPDSRGSCASQLCNNNGTTAWCWSCVSYYTCFSRTLDYSDVR